MSSFYERFNLVVQKSGLTKTAFAKRINISQAMVSMLCSGASAPSDRTIREVCEKFNVNEDWLRTGTGDMYCPVSRDAEIASFMGDIMRGEDADFRRRLISVLARLDVSEWELLEKMALKLAEEAKKEDQAKA